MDKIVLHGKSRSRWASRRVDEFANFYSKKLLRSFFVRGRKASRRRASFAEHTTRFDSLAPSASSRFRARICMYVCVRTMHIRLYVYMWVIRVVVSYTRAWGRSERGINRRIEREREGDKWRSREQGCTRALFACVYDVNIIRQTHLNRLKILTSISPPPPLRELSARCVRLYKSAYPYVAPVWKYSSELYDRSRNHLISHLPIFVYVFVWGSSTIYW